MLIIVGHNEAKQGGNERVLRCPDGSMISLSKISKLSEENTSPCLILSCETINEYGINGIVTTKRLEFDEMAKALKKTQLKIGSFIPPPPPTVKDYLKELEIAFQESKSKLMRNTKLVVLGSSGAIIVVGFFSTSTKHK